MDRISGPIAELAAGLTYHDLPLDVRAAARQRLVDAVGCAIGGRGATPSTIAERVAPELPAGTGTGRMIGGESGATTADAAAFANTVMLRYLDFNDWYPGAHPSDCLGALLAVAEHTGASGQRLLTAMAVCYEVAVGLTVASEIRVKGWDQGLPMGIAVAAGVGSLLGLPAETIAHAVGIMAASNVPLRVTRSGHLSLWKGAATAYANRNGVFAALLAAEGMTGPDAPFEGRNGVMDLVTGPFELELDVGAPDHVWVLPRSSLKYWPVCYHLQAAVWAARDLRNRVADTELRSIDVSTYRIAWKDTGDEPEKWDPASRETADHSLPYVLCRGLRRGRIGPEDFEESAYRDPTLRPEMARVRVRTDEDIDAAFPGDTLMRVRAGAVDGTVHEVEVRNPRGHWKNPIDDDDVRRKFTGLVAPVLGEEAAGLALDLLWRIDAHDDLRGCLDALRVPHGPGGSPLTTSDGL